MKISTRLFLPFAATLLGSALPVLADVLAYDNLSTPATAGYSESAVNRPIFGDSLVLSQGGPLTTFGFGLFNSTGGGNTGAILTGTMRVSFYDNTIPYTGGVLSGPLLGSTVLLLDFTADGGLSPGYYSTEHFDLSGLNIVLPQNVFVTQQFTETSGTSTRVGAVLLGNPTVGSSPNTVYFKSSATPEGLYTLTGNPGQFAYSVSVATVPEPATIATNALVVVAGVGAWVAVRRRAKS